MKTSNISLALISSGLLWCSHALSNESTQEPDEQTYPTTVIVDYVIGCMAANGQTHEMLQKCSCSIDYIRKAIPYGTYEKIETLASLQQMAGAGRNAVYSNSTWAKDAMTKMREVQADSTLRCF
jgi:hypothetical protein